jgi:hypothetical protein
MTFETDEVGPTWLDIVVGIVVGTVIGAMIGFAMFQ